MQQRERCPNCKKQLVRYDTDGNGRLVVVETPCRCRPADMVDKVRKRAGICQRCLRPVKGRKGQALYCPEHRRVVHQENKRKYEARLRRDAEARALTLARRRASWRKYAAKHREKQRQYKREWRRHNPDKVAKQRRRYALSGKLAAAIRRRRELQRAGLLPPTKPAPRNERGERLCCGQGCSNVVRGRAKLCDACKAERARKWQERAA